MADELVGVRAEGVDRTRAGLRAVGQGAQNEVDAALERAGQTALLPRARALTPVGTRPKPAGVPHLVDTLTVVPRARGVAIRSRAVYANPIHWGWPKRGIKGSRFAWRAGEEMLDEFEREIEAGLDRFFRERGL